MTSFLGVNTADTTFHDTRIWHWVVG